MAWPWPGPGLGLALGPGIEEAARKVAVAQPLGLGTETATRKLAGAAPLRLGKETAARKSGSRARAQRHKPWNLLEVGNPELLFWIFVRAMCLSSPGFLVGAKLEPESRARLRHPVPARAT